MIKTVDLLQDGADRAAEAGAAGALPCAGGTGEALALGARRPGAVTLLTHAAARESHGRT